MSYRFEPGKLYRMPTHFGPSLGPRQGPGERKYVGAAQEITKYTLSFRSDPEQLEALLPERFTLARPVVSIVAKYATGIEWLAGRGYNMLSVEIPVEFSGERDHVRGSFVTVMWESLADPIITGRDDLGYSKIFCEIPPPMFRDDLVHLTAGWLGFKFLDVKIQGLEDAPAGASSNEPPSDGSLHFKYIPRTEEWGKADVCYPVLIPTIALSQDTVVAERKVGQGTATWHRAEWEDLPTFYPIVNTFADLEVREYLGATRTRTVGTSPIFSRRSEISPARILK